MGAPPGTAEAGRGGEAEGVWGAGDSAGVFRGTQRLKAGAGRGVLHLEKLWDETGAVRG